MKHWGPLLLTTLLAVSACGGEPAPAAPALSRASEAATTATAATSACPESGVRITVGASDAAMGLRVQQVRLRNCGESPYHLDGYPQLRVLDADREPLDVRIAHGSADIATVDGFDAPPRPLTLRHGEVAETNLMWRNTVTTSAAPQVGEYLSITPAEGRSWQPVRPAPAEKRSERPEPPVRIDGRRPDGLHIDLGTTAKLGVRAWHRPAES